MTVSSSTSKVSFSGNGSLTTFAYSFKIFDQDDLTVILRAADGTETVQTITTHYTVTGVGSASGGNVVFGSAPANGVTVVILREQPFTQGLDLVPNDPFPAASLEEALDKLVFMAQKHEEELGRAIKGSRTNVISNSEFTVSATDRANKVFSFDGSGNLAVTQELGTFKGNWATSTTYVARDIVKDTSTNNIFIVNADHTSSGAQPLTTNANSAKYDLLVDAASATTSATNAAASATTATTKASEAATSATNAATSATASETAKTAAETALDSFDDRYLGAKSSDPSTDNDGNALITSALYFNTSSGMKVYDGSSWDDIKPTSSEQTNIDAVAADATDIGTVAGISSNVTTVAGISGNVTTVAGISSDVTAVAGDATDIGTVATNISNVNAVGGISANVTTVAGISSNVTTVAGISANVTTVAGDTTNIGTIATNLGGTDTIGTVAGSISNINTVAGSITNVNTVSSNITGVNSFAERYRVSSSDPTTSLDAGDLAFNTTSSLLKYYSGSSWQSISPGIGSVADDSTPQLGGDLDLNSNDITGTGNINITGAGTFSSDLNIADKIVHTGDTNTAIRFPSDDTVSFETGGSERARVDSSGNFIVGKTTSAVGVAGTSIESTGRVEINADSTTPLNISRITDEGDMIQFYEGSTLRGRIGIELNDMFISSANSGLRFDYNNTRVVPCTTTGAGSDNTDDFGDPSVRWKDGYFAGTITAGAFSGDGSALTGTGGATDFQEFTSSGTYTKPSGVNYIFVEAIGGGGSGAKGNFDGDGAQGGGGGAYVSQLFRASDVGSTETVTIGAGGASQTSGGAGNDGGTTSFGSLVTALGGEGGLKNNSSGRGAPYDRSNTSSVDNNVVVSYAGKGGLANGFGGKTIYGGGGGGGAKTTNRDGGASVFGGDGGEGFSDGTNGAAGTAPGGGGGAADTGNSGAGAAGRIRVSAW